MNMENFTSVFNSADGPTSIFVAGKTPEIMGVLIAIVVVGVIISLFGLKLVRVLSAMMGLGTGAVIGAVIGTVAGLDTTKMVATIAVCGVVLCIMCAVLRKFGIFVMTFLGSWGTFVTLVEARSVIVLGICAAVALVIAILTVIFAEFLVIFVTGIVGGVEAGMALPFLLGMTKIGWIGYVMSAAIAVIGITVQTMMQSRKIGKREKIFSKKIKESMTSEGLVTAKEGITLDEAKKILAKARKEKLPIVDDEGNLSGLITIKDIEKQIKYPNSAKDAQGRLLCGAGVGVTANILDRVDALVKAKVDVIVIDTAHGHSANVLRVVKMVRDAYPDLGIIAGNVATGEATKALIEAGVDAVK